MGQFAGTGPDRLAEMLQAERNQRARSFLERGRALREGMNCMIRVVAVEPPLLADLPEAAKRDAATHTVSKLVPVALPWGAEWVEPPEPPEPDPRLLEGKP